jgi:hypothetical protein
MSRQRHPPQDSITVSAEADPLLQRQGVNGAGAQRMHRGVGMTIVLMILIAAAAAIGFSVVGVWLGRRFLRGRVAAGHHEVLLAFLQTGGTLHAVFWAFLVVAVWQSYDAARANVADEGSALTTLYRESAGMEPTMGNSLRKLIREYVDAVIRDEWKIQAETGGASSKARAASLGMYRLFGREDPATKQQESSIDGAALQLISQIQYDRNKRTLEAGESLPVIIWFAAISSGVLALSMSFLLFMDQVMPQVIVTSMMAGMITLLLCITSVLSRPFVGPLALQPQPFAHSLEVFDAVDATP